MSRNLLCCHLLVLILAIIVVAASGKKSCSPFSVLKVGKCVSCPQSGLARPLELSCYDKIEVRYVQAISSSVDVLSLAPDSIQQIVKQSIDTDRYQKMTPFNGTAGDKLRFTVGFLDMKKHVDKFLVWKPKQQDGSDCVFNASQYKFYARSSLRSLFTFPSRNSNVLEGCQQSDMGDYVMVQCEYQRVLALDMARSDGQELTECDIPAEVEAFGTEVTPQIVFSAAVKTED